MKHYKLSLAVKIATIVFLAFTIVLSNEIRLGIDRYIKNRLETDAIGTIRNMEKFSKSYVDSVGLTNVDLSSQEFKDIYNNVVGDSTKIKCLVNKNGKILNLSREGIERPNISVTLDQYKDNTSWYAYIDLNFLNEKQREKLETILKEDDGQTKYFSLEGNLGEPDEIYANEFKVAQVKSLKVNGQTVIENDYDGDVEIYNGQIHSYMSYSMEILYASSVSESKKNSSLSGENISMMVLDYQDAMKGLQYQIQKNFKKMISSAKELSQGTYDYSQYYLASPYEYHDKYYSTIILPLEDWSLLSSFDNIEYSSDEIVEQVTIGYIFVTQEYNNITTETLKQFMLDNSSTYFLAFILVIFICMSIAYMIIKPIRRIETTAKHIARKEFDYPIDTSRHDEIGDLARNIDVMSKELEKTINNLYQEIDRVQKLEVIRKDFVSNFTHEIKTPLGIINGFSELVELEQDEEKRIGYIKIVQNETKRINELVLAMLDLSKLESQNVSLNLEEIDLLPIIDDSIESMNYLFQKKNIHLIVDLQSTMIKADRFKIEMVVNNFLSNALRYTKEGKNVIVTLKDSLFSVENEGSAIPEKDILHVWDAFHKVDKARNEEGTGLGLAICKAVLDLHRFRYGVKNTEYGVLFYFEW